VTAAVWAGYTYSNTPKPKMETELLKFGSWLSRFCMQVVIQYKTRP